MSALVLGLVIAIVVCAALAAGLLGLIVALERIARSSGASP